MSALRTVLAVVLAAGLVAGATYVRSTVIEGSVGTSEGGAIVEDGEEEPVVATRVACDEALGPACPSGSASLDVEGLLDAFATTPVPFDVLIAPSAVVALVQDSQTSRARFAADGVPVATTPVVLAVATSRDEVVADACGAEVTWACTAELVRTGQLAPSFGDPQTATIGLAALAATTGGFLGTPTYRTNDLGGAEFITWLDAVRGQVRTMDDPLRTLVLFGGAQNDSAITTEADALDTLARAAAAVPDVHWPTPLAHLTAVVVGVEGQDGGDLDAIAAAAAQALTEAGWRDATGTPPPASGAATPPALDIDAPGLPAGGVLFTLRGRWE